MDDEADRRRILLGEDPAWTVFIAIWEAGLRFHGEAWPDGFEYELWTMSKAVEVPHAVHVSLSCLQELRHGLDSWMVWSDDHDAPALVPLPEWRPLLDVGFQLGTHRQAIERSVQRGSLALILDWKERLKRQQEEDKAYDIVLTDDERARVSLLTSGDIARLDEAILRRTGRRFMKVFGLILETNIRAEGGLGDLPFGFIGERIIELVRRGELEARGDLRRSRFSEVRRSGEGSI